MIFHPGGFDELGGEMRQAAAAGPLDEKQREAIFNTNGESISKLAPGEDAADPVGALTIQ